MSDSSYDSIPTRTDPGKLYQVCEFLHSTGTARKDVVAEETGISERDTSATVNYGIELGFIEKSDEGYSATPRGFDLALASGVTEETEDLFQDGIVECHSYSDIITYVWEDNEDTIREEDQITEHQIMRALRTDLGFIDHAEETLAGGIRTFLKTIESAGCGTYKRAYDGNPARVELTESGISFLESIAASTETKSGDASKTKVEDSASSRDRWEEATGGTSHSSHIRRDIDTSDDAHTGIVGRLESESVPFTVNVNIEIADKMSSENVKEIIKGIREGMDADLNSNDTKE